MEVAATPRDELDPLRRAWEANPAVPFAADLVGAALVLGRSEEARDAAKFLLRSGENVSPVANRLALQVLGEIEGTGKETVPSVATGIRTLRSLLQRVPRDPLTWLDLAWAHSANGSNDAAEKAIRAALSLAPHHRVVLRSGARFLVHQHRPDEAHDLLRRAPQLARDPWLLAAEIATADVADRVSKNVKIGRRMLESRAFSPLHLSELAAALGTLELDAGAQRQARKLFELGIREGTENTVAQFAWAAHWVARWDIPPELLEVPNAFEATLWERFHAAVWPEVIDAAIQWHRDEPFSARPAVIGSGVAIQIDEFGVAESLILEALRANPRHPGLLNNLTVALAVQGRVQEAYKAFRKIRHVGLDDELKVTIAATAGLLNFRAGHIQAGRTHYDAAIEWARQHNMRGTAARALLFKIREELRSGAPETSKLLEQAEMAAKEVRHELIGVTQHFLKRMRELAEQVQQHGPPSGSAQADREESNDFAS